MKISILLPYKENFSSDYPGAVSLFIKDTSIKSRYKKNICVVINLNCCIMAIGVKNTSGCGGIGRRARFRF